MGLLEGLAGGLLVTVRKGDCAAWTAEMMAAVSDNLSADGGLKDWFLLAVLKAVMNTVQFVRLRCDSEILRRRRLMGRLKTFTRRCLRCVELLGTLQRLTNKRT